MNVDIQDYPEDIERAAKTADEYDQLRATRPRVHREEFLAGVFDDVRQDERDRMGTYIRWYITQAWNDNDKASESYTLPPEAIKYVDDWIYFLVNYGLGDELSARWQRYLLRKEERERND